MAFRLFIFLVLAAFFPYTTHAVGIGFVNSSGVWFSSEPIFAGVPVKAYTVVLNNEFKQLAATIAFFEDGKEFGRTSVTIQQEEARQISMLWTPSFGNHTISARFISAVVSNPDGTLKQLSQNELDALAGPISRNESIDNDSDKDGIGDHEEIATYGTSPTKFDSDDDALSDKDEINKYKTNPNNPNTDGDNMNDGDEVHIGRNPLIKDDPAPPPPPAPPTPPPPSSSNFAQQKPVVQKTLAPQQKVTTIEPLKNSGTKLPLEKIVVKKTVTPTKTKNIIADISAPSTELEIESATSTLPATSTELEIPSAPRQPSTPVEKDSEGTWVTVLAVIAGLFASAAAVTGALAWREKNRY